MPIDELFHESNKANKGDKVSIRVIFEGKVQKVGLRHWIKQKAVSLEIYGWVRNRANGTVEALFFGYETDVGEMMKLCYQGPSFAFIKKVREFPQVDTANLPQEFMILPTV